MIAPSREDRLTLYLVVPPLDISRTKPLVRLILNQIGRRPTEALDGSDGIARRHRLLLMLYEFPALGRLDFFETALAFMAGYGIRSFLIAQSLNQIDKAYGQNHSISPCATDKSSPRCAECTAQSSFSRHAPRCA